MRNRLRNTCYICLLSLVCGGVMAMLPLTPVSAEAPGTKLKLESHLKSGDRFAVDLHLETRVAKTEPDWVAVRKLAADLRLDCRVLKVDPATGALCRITVAKVAAREQTPFETSEFPAPPASGSLSPEVQSLAQLSGLALTIQVPPAGKAYAVESAKQAADAKLDSEKLTSMSSMELLALLLGGANNPWEATLQEVLLDLFSFLPEREAIGIGDAWQAGWTLPFARLPLKSVLQLQTIAAGPEVVDLKATAQWVQHIEKNDTVPGTGGQSYQGKVIYQLNGDLDGRLQIDARNGWLKQAGFKASLVGNAERGDRSVPLTLELRFDWQTVR